jgi:hypothetical protein
MERSKEAVVVQKTLERKAYDFLFYKILDWHIENRINFFL